MRFLTVTAHSFGALANETLTLAPGMTLVWGPNEAGKSTWHAALYAALCGQRRGRGANRKADQAFATRYRPWDGGQWQVSALIELADSRRVELRQDLDEKATSRAIDVTLGRDCTAEIICDGAPDGARWLGLDRDAFLATACVRQADLLGILDAPATLQEHLQRAAATSGSDGTAAGAIERIDRFHRDHVGHAGRKPLPVAVAEVERARRALQVAQSAHTAYLDLLARVDALTREAAAAEAKLHRAEASLQWDPPAALADRVARAQAHATSLLPDRWLPFFFAGVSGLCLIAAAITWLAAASVSFLLPLSLLAGALVAGVAAIVCVVRRQRARLAALEALRHAQEDLLAHQRSAESATATRLAALRAAAAAAAQARDETRGQAAERAATIPSVAEAEEALAAAETEHTRLRCLDETLSLTRQFLANAQERVHRTIAPRLATSVRTHLPTVTAGRYQDAAVDPQSLDVQVRDAGGAWHRAAHLSHGTAEQTYLLLRAALAEHLTRPGEVCPLLLDDVTVHCDADRKRAVLTTLHTLSRTHQVILFSHEPAVLTWAQATSHSSTDAVVSLALPLVKSPDSR